MAEGFDNSLGVARRPLDMEDYVDILRRQKAWIIGPTFAALVVAVVTAFLWDDTYISTAVVRVVPSQVPQELVPTNLNLEMNNRINAMAQEILSRSTLTNIIQTNNLYERDRARLPMEDVVENMRKRDIKLSTVTNVTAGQSQRQVPAFQISFSYEKRADAQKVCQDLVSRFISENQRFRAQNSASTTAFLKDQWEQRRRELEQVEDRLAKFRVTHSGQLPEQVQQNLQQLNALESRLSNLNSRISSINQEKLLTDAQVRIFKDQLSKVGSPESEVQVAGAVKEQQKNEQIAKLENEIILWETRLAALREQYKDDWPEVKSTIQNLTVLKRQKAALEKLQDTAKKAPAPEPPKPVRVVNQGTVRDIRDLDASIKRLQSNLEAKDIELEEAKREAQRVEAQIQTTQRRLDSTPLEEKEYVDLLRDRDMVRQQVEELNKKQSMSKIAEDLEKRQQSETLELLDPASLPQKPAQPDRVQIVAIGTGVGLALGIFLAVGREVKDTSLKNLKDVRAYTQLQILGSIPLLENDLVVRRRRRLGMLAWSTALILGCMIMGGSMYYYMHFVSKV